MSMMSPQTYFNEHFKGKSKEQQEFEIKKLEKQIKELEAKIQTPIKPSPILSLNITKMYLEYAQKAMSNDIVNLNVKELTLNDVFTITSKTDPLGEEETKKIVAELEDSLHIKSIYSGVPVYFSDIISMMKGKNILELEEIFKKEHIKLPDAKNTREAILNIIFEKVNKL